MKKNSKKIEIIFAIICFIGLIVYSVLSKDNKTITKLSIFLISLALFLGISFCILYFFILKNKLIGRKIKNNYKMLKEKSEKNLYDELYILTYQKKATQLLKQSLNQKKIKEINGIIFQNTSDMKILMYCKYKGFSIITLFSDNSVQYGIDSPTKYDGTKINRNFEKLSNREINYDIFSDIEDLNNYISDLINELKEKIDTFVKENVVDPIFNGRLLDKLSTYSSFLKKEGLICVIFCPPLALFMLFGFIYALVDENYKVENPIGFYVLSIFSFIFFIVFLFLFFYGIKLLIVRANIKKDYEQKNLSIIHELPKKVKIVKDKPGKYSNVFFLRSIIVYFEEIKLVIPCSSEIINKVENIKKCSKECENIKTELQYLTESKIVVAGEKRFVNVIKRYLF